MWFASLADPAWLRHSAVALSFSLDLCLARLVHMEASKSELLAMLGRWEEPLPTEAHGLSLLTA